MSDTILVNAEMEQGLLGAIMMSPKALDQVSYLTSEDFAHANHQAIWIAVEAIRARGEPVNPISVCQLLGAHLEDAGGQPYIARLAAASPGAMAVGHWAKQLRDLSAKRRLREVIHGMSIRLERDGEVTAEELAADVVHECEAVSARSAPRILTVRQVREAELEAMKQPLPCYSTGFTGLDRAMGGGMYPRRAYAIAARKKQGKTAMAGDISDALNHAGVKHLYIACEMGADQIEHRIMAKHLNVNALAFLDPRYRGSPAFISKVAAYTVKAPNNALYLNAPGLTFEDLRRNVTHAVLAHRIKGFILDYLQLVGGKQRNQSTAEHLDIVGQWIAEVCKTHGLFCLCLAQINQEGNVRGGESIRLAFDQVYELKRQLEGEGTGAWLEMLDSRYTKWQNVGSEQFPGFWLETATGPWYRESNAHEPQEAA
jgi:replicative DNA helicase